MERRMHAWRIEEREYRRQPARTALIVMDVVPFFARESAYVRGIGPSIARRAGDVRTTDEVIGLLTA